MTANTNKDFFMKQIDFLNSVQGDTGKIRDYPWGKYFAAEFKYHARVGEIDLWMFKQYSLLLTKAFPDTSWKVNRLIAEPDLVVGELTANWTHSNPLNGVPSAGKTLESEFLVICRMAKNRCTEMWAVGGYKSAVQPLRILYNSRVGN